MKSFYTLFKQKNRKIGMFYMEALNLCEVLKQHGGCQKHSAQVNLYTV